MKYLSTFTGIGGFELGIHAAIDDAECVGYSEIDKYAINTYESHYEHHNYGDITAINATTLPRFDLIVGGFPCQAFSVAGKRRGFEETRGTLFFDVARILADKRPGHLVLENVKGLLSHDAGKTFATILGVLADLGYRVEWQVLNSKHFGVPQNRERVYIIGHLRDQCSRQILPIKNSYRPDFALSSPASRPTQKFIKTRHLSQNGGLISDDVTLQASEVPHILHNVYNGFKEKNVRVFRDYSPTIRTPAGGGHIPAVTDGMKIRRLTPKECERLQGFPDNWTLGSDTQRYKQCGNAVTTNVVEAVMLKLKECLI